MSTPNQPLTDIYGEPVAGGAYSVCVVCDGLIKQRDMTVEGMMEPFMNPVSRELSWKPTDAYFAALKSMEDELRAHFESHGTLEVVKRLSDLIQEVTELRTFKADVIAAATSG
jgi:hypothetical protein